MAYVNVNGRWYLGKCAKDSDSINEYKSFSFLANLIWKRSNFFTWTKPNRTTTTTRLWWRWNYRNSDCPYIFESQTEQQLLRDFGDDEITEIRTVHTFLKAKQNNNFLCSRSISYLSSRPWFRRKCNPCWPCRTNWPADPPLSSTTPGRWRPLRKRRSRGWTSNHRWSNNSNNFRLFSSFLNNRKNLSRFRILKKDSR